jgi:hypothetical protein
MKPSVAALRRGLEVGLSVSLLFGTVEVAFRWLRPMPTVQLIDTRIFPTETVEGVPFWDPPPEKAEELTGWDCVGERHVVLAGDSIWYITSAGEAGRYEDNIVAHLRARFAGRGVCFHNVSVSGYGAVQQQIALRQALDRVGPSLGILQVYKPDAQWRRAGPWWVDVGSLRRDDEGRPQVPWLTPYVPLVLEGWLWEHATAWRYAVTTLAPPGKLTGEGYRPFLTSPDARLLGRVLFESPRTDRPFRQYVAERADFYREIHDEADARGIPYVEFARQLFDVDPVSIRVDPECHLNGEGHRRMADALAPAIEAWLATSPPSAAAPASSPPPTPP